jgi:Mg2+ and Co2+ transporter CorA
MMTLEDNKKSIEQAVTVNRLTKLAFIFIPLNFVTSAFGINLIELGTGKAELWMVVVACVTLGMVILTVVSFALRGSKKAVRDYVESSGSTSRLMTLWRLGQCSFRETF